MKAGDGMQGDKDGVIEGIVERCFRCYGILCRDREGCGSVEVLAPEGQRLGNVHYGF